MKVLDAIISVKDNQLSRIKESVEGYSIKATEPTRLTSDPHCEKITKISYVWNNEGVLQKYTVTLIYYTSKNTSGVRSMV